MAIAGKVKAGKSTLLNALVGEQVAPTDAGECTRVVTWYRDGATPADRAAPARRARRGRCRCAAHDGALTIDLGGDARPRSASGWSSTGPSQSLRVDHADRHPGHRLAVRGGLAAHRRLPRPRRRHAHRGRRRRLPHAPPARARRRVPRGVPRPRGGPGRRPVNAIAVLSRADEIGGGRVDAMFSARGIAARYRADPTVRGLCQNVVAVAGLLAETGRTLRQTEHTALAALARAAARRAGGRSCCSVDRFLRAGRDGDVTAEVRQRLLARFGLFGIRLSTSLIRQGADTPGRARDRAGRPQRAARAAAGAAHAVHRAPRRAQGPVRAAGGGRGAAHRRRRGPPGPRWPGRSSGSSRARTSSPSCGCSARCAAARSTLPSRRRRRGRAAAGRRRRVRRRPGWACPPDAPPDELRQAAYAALERWQRHTVNPMLGRATADACRAVVRSCEGILAGLRTADLAAKPVRREVHRSERGTRGHELVPPSGHPRRRAWSARRTGGGSHGRTGRQRDGPIVIAQIVPGGPRSDAGAAAEQAWRDGDVLGAIEAADRALAAGDRLRTAGRPGWPRRGPRPTGPCSTPPPAGAGSRARSTARPPPARPAGRRWPRRLAGDVAAAVGDLATARDQLPDPAPRGLTVLLGGAGAVVEARGRRARPASRHLAGLAAASVRARPDGRRTPRRAGRHRDGRRRRRSTPRGRCCARCPATPTGRAAAARAPGSTCAPATSPPPASALAAAARTPVLRRDALLGAAVTVGLARRTRRRRRHRRHLGTGSPRSSPAPTSSCCCSTCGASCRWSPSRCRRPTATLVVDAMRAALRRAGSPVVGGRHRPVVAARAGRRRRRRRRSRRRRGRARRARRTSTRGCAAGPTRPRAWAAVLAGRVCPETVDAAAARLADDGLRDEAAALCRAAAQRTSDPAATRRLLGAGRGLRPATGRAPRRRGCCPSGNARWARWCSTG